MEKLNHSNFFLTLNTNQNIRKKSRDDQEKLIDKFEETLLNLFSDPNHFISILNEGEDMTPKFIKDINVEFNTEIQPNKGCLHSHVIIKIKHKTKLQICLPKVRSYVCNKMSLSNIYINIRFFRNASDNMEDYLAKRDKNQLAKKWARDQKFKEKKYEKIMIFYQKSTSEKVSERPKI